MPTSKTLELNINGKLIGTIPITIFGQMEIKVGDNEFIDPGNYLLTPGQIVKYARDLYIRQQSIEKERF